MTWSYSTDPSTSPLDALRFNIGDTNRDAQQFTNEELLYLLGQNTQDPVAAGIDAVSRLISKYARLVDKTVGDLQIRYSQQYDHYLTVKDDLLVASGGGAVSRPIAYAGGISVADRQLQDGNLDRVRPLFEIGQDDYEKSTLLDDPRINPGNPV